MKPFDQCHLYTFIDTAYLHGRKPSEIARQLCAGGSDLIQLRAKKSSPDEIHRMAEEIQPILQKSNVGLVINDHPDIAKKIGADLCHLGQEDFFDLPHSQRPTLNSQLGLSTHSPDQAARALAANPAYIAIGPVYATGTKPTAKPVTLEYVRWAAANVKTPWFAIGGINLTTLEDVLVAGANRICVVSAILNAKDVAEECQKYSVMLRSVKRASLR